MSFYTREGCEKPIMEIVTKGKRFKYFNPIRSRKGYVVIKNIPQNFDLIWTTEWAKMGDETARLISIPLKPKP